MKTKVELNYSITDTRAVLSLAGRFTLDNKEQFQNFIDEHVDGAQDVLVLDMSQLEFIDSAGIGDLIKLKMGPAKHYKQLYVCGLQDAVERVFRVSGLVQLFEIIDPDEVDAL